MTTRQGIVRFLAGLALGLAIWGGAYGVWRVVRMHHHDVAAARQARRDLVQAKAEYRFELVLQRREMRAELARLHVLVRCQGIGDPKHLTSGVSMERVRGKVRIIVSGKLVCP